MSIPARAHINMGVHTTANSVYHQALKSCTFRWGPRRAIVGQWRVLWQRKARSRLIPKSFYRK
jgi:hypothetical protein